MSDVDKLIDELKMLTETTTNTELAEALGMARGTVQNWKIRGKIPDRVFLKARQVADGASKTKVAAKQSKYVELDFYEVEVSAGSGALVQREEQSDGIAFSLQFH